MASISPRFKALELLRVTAAGAARILPDAASVRVERRLRGWEEAQRLARADAVITSFGKAGRTWLRVMISRFYAHRHGLPEGQLMEFDEFHRASAAIPVIQFTHDNYLKDHLGHARKFESYGAKPVILLVRDPRDTAVSQYYQWKHRMARRKKVINAYPLGETDVAAFLDQGTGSVASIIAFMNAWAQDLARFPKLLILRYEDLRADPEGQMRRVLEFLGAKPQAPEIADCVAYASLDNMRKAERENAAKARTNSRLRPGNAADPASFKARRGKVGGWRDEVSPAAAEQYDRLVRETLSPIFGYDAAATEGGLVSASRGC